LVKIHSHFAGTTLKDFHMEVQWRHTMNTAAAVGDDNPFYFDDEREGGVIAPPMFPVVTTWPIVERIWEYIQADDFPREIVATQVHYREHLEFYRSLRPGDTVTIRGEVAAIFPHRAGTQVVVKFDAVDAQGVPVFTEYNGALMRGVECPDGGQGAETLPETPPFEASGPALWQASIPIGRLQPFIYDGCTNIFFPIHTSKRFARRVGLPGTILQGTATLAFACRELVNREAGGDPRRLRILGCRFSQPVLPGTTIAVRLMAREMHEQGAGLHFSVLNQEGERALSGGYAFFKKSGDRP